MKTTINCHFSMYLVNTF